MASKVNITVPTLSSLDIQIRLDGQWSKLDTLASNLQSSVLSGYGKGVHLIGQRLLRIVKRALLTGTPPAGSGITWQPLAPSTIKKYGDHPIYNLTGSYANSINITTYKSRTIIGVPLRAKRSSKGKLTLNQLAILLEYGSLGEDGRIPARPVWGPSLKALGGKAAIKAELIRQIRSSLYQNTHIRPNQVR